ncbi:MAG TPA: M23 family metallopeptidase [Myxococcaceae bacterium]|nr:M23 family metallopeptidase [Myxococcaceae bacterium]
MDDRGIRKARRLMQAPSRLLALGTAAGLLACLGSGCAARPSAVARAETGGHTEPELVGRRHLVAPGETLFRVAKIYGVSPEALAAENGITDSRELTPGQELVIPDSAGVSGKSEQAAPIPGKPPPAARGKNASAERETAGDLNWPLRGVLYARFGRHGREVHDGIDLAAPVGTPVKTAGPGTVVYAGEQRGYGLLAIVEHPNGLTTLYAHNHDLRVKTGQQVRAGQVIASVGESGRTTGPHLHFEVRRAGVPVDPLPHLGPIPR